MNAAPAYRLVRFDASSSAPAADLAVLHARLLGHSPVALLGPDFMCEFYYRVLPRLGLIFGAVAYVDEQPAGFIVGTADSAGFMRAGVVRAPFRLAWVLARSIARSPRERLPAIREALGILRGVEQVHSPTRVGELLSFAVLPEFRARSFVSRTGYRISQDLMREALRALRASGVATARAIVDADNLEARLFYLGNGWIPGLAKVPGWRKHTVEFLWEAQAPGAPVATPVVRSADA